MKPVICKSTSGWVIYMRPSMTEAKNRMTATHGEQWDAIERTRVAGGVPEAMQKLPGVYATEREAMAASRFPAALAA